MLKQAITPPHRHSEAGHISFCHPGYESPDDILFELPRLDRSEDRNDSENPRTIESTPSIGVHHRTALLACQIIADNAFEGYLATDRDGQHRVLAIPDGLLTDDTYWFIANRAADGQSLVDGRDFYPIVPRFEDWKFPHASFRTLGWDSRQSSHTRSQQPSFRSKDASRRSRSGRHTGPFRSPAVPLAPPPLPRSTDRSCILSSTSYSIQKAHIIPSAHEKWSRDNAMVVYSRRGSNNLINNAGNVVGMRHDLHNLWDAQRLCTRAEMRHLCHPRHLYIEPPPGGVRGVVA